MDEILDKHYKGFADNYDKYLRYSPEFVRQLSSKMVEKLDLKPDDVFIDLGGGTGIFSLDIHKQIKFRSHSYCVDAFQEMLNQIPLEIEKIRPVCMDALSFSADGYSFNKVLIKEAVHHVEEREALFNNLYNKLPAGGRLLLVHVPPDIKYPIFDAALERALNWHACPDELTRQLTRAGFKVERDSLDYPHKIDKTVYFSQVRSRFMSVLHTFSDTEMDSGLKEMEEKYKGVDTLEFIDHFDYLTAVKS